MKRGKAFLSFDTIKEVFNLPEDALLKQFIISPLEDGIEIEFYSNEGEVEVGHTGNIRREALTKPDNMKLTVNVGASHVVDFEELSRLIKEQMAKNGLLGGSAIVKKFVCEVTRVDKYEIQFDEKIFDEKFIEDFKRVFYDFDSLSEHAEHIAQHRARFQQHFIEGYGIPLINGKEPFTWDTEKKNIEEGINIKIIDEDNDIEVDVVEIEEEE